MNILKTISIHISIKKGIFENINIGMDCFPEEIMLYVALFKVFHDAISWLYEEMLGMNPSIVEHEIKTYDNVKIVRQKLRLINPKKVDSIKNEVEKLLNVGSIYLFPLADWVSIAILVGKRKGTILGV